MSTGLAVLVTCLSAACGGGRVAGDDSLSFATAGDTEVSSVVSAGGVMPAAAGGRKSTGGPGNGRGGGSDTTTGGGTATGGTTTGVPSTGGTVTGDPGTGGTTTGGTSTGGTEASAYAVRVDISRIPAPGVGTDKVNVAATDEIAPAGAGAFRTVCGFSHMSFDDPIVFPGQPGRSHLHTFFGNTGANAGSTAESLRNTGNSTCRGGTANRSSYWVPTLIDTRDSTPIKPDIFIVYYKNGYLPAPSVMPMPVGLRMIAGDPGASGPHPEVFSSRWKCLGGPNKQNALYGPSIGNCDVGANLEQEVFFPQCWDGVNLDSPDHKSHMSYTIRVKNLNDPTGATHAECPKTHPVVLPQIAFNVAYTVREKDAPLHWRLASDNYDRSLPGGFSSHGDWFNGWKSDISEAWARGCIEAAKDCHAHLLGDGRKIY